MSGVMCEYCDAVFDPVRFRWRCPACGFKADCCTGEPQQVCRIDPDIAPATPTDIAPTAPAEVTAAVAGAEPTYPKYARAKRAVIDLTVPERSAS